MKLLFFTKWLIFLVDRFDPQDVPEGDIEEGAVGGQHVYSYAETPPFLQGSLQR